MDEFRPGSVKFWPVARARRAVCKRRGAVGSGPVFLKHNIRNAYDELSDLAELYAFTRAPAVCILHDGAVKVLTDAALTLP